MLNLDSETQYYLLVSLGTGLVGAILWLGLVRSPVTRRFSRSSHNVYYRPLPRID